MNKAIHVSKKFLSYHQRVRLNKVLKSIPELWDPDREAAWPKSGVLGYTDEGHQWIEMERFIWNSTNEAQYEKGTYSGEIIGAMVRRYIRTTREERRAKREHQRHL